jgi:class 3 adenylate cyclase
MGQVVVKGNDLLGETVKIAARLEGIASPNAGICISEIVHQQVKSVLQVPFRDMGLMPVNTPARSVRAFAVDLETLATGVRPPPSTVRELNPGVFIAAAILVAFAGLAMLMG